MTATLRNRFYNYIKNMPLINKLATVFLIISISVVFLTVGALIESATEECTESKSSPIKECKNLFGTKIIDESITTEPETNYKPNYLGNLFTLILLAGLMTAGVLFLASIGHAYYSLLNIFRRNIQAKRRNRQAKAKEREKARDYEEAVKIWESLGDIEEAARVRALKTEQNTVNLSQKVVHGDEVTKTEIKDSVLNRSNVGSGGSSKIQELEKLAEMKDKGIIDDDEFKQMKKEILEK